MRWHRLIPLPKTWRIMSTRTDADVAAATITYADAVRRALADEMRADDAVFLMGEDVGARGGVFNVTEGLLGEFGAERVRDTPISEAGITAAAVGAAVGGRRPVLEIMFNDFLPLALDQLVNEGAKLHYMTGGQITVPVTVRTTYGLARSGAAHHSQTLYAWLCHVPGLKVVAPSAADDAYAVLRAAIRDPGPVVFFEDKGLYAVPFPSWQHVPDAQLGTARVRRPGTHVTVVAIGRFVQMALAVAEDLAPGIDVEVIDPRTLYPLDDATLLASAQKTGRVIVIEGGVRRFGVAAEIAARVTEGAFDFLDAPVQRLAAREVVIPFSAPLEACVQPTSDDLRGAILEMGSH